ncbi:MAG: hypothetical protein JO208_08110 [Alphaproteobacteria bacterium]|nr:hypothetical protein [Alphaproteobacteria bacterium]
MSVTGDVLFKRGHKWNAGTFNLCFSVVGNLELRENSSGRLIWESGTSGGAKLAMQADGNLVIYAVDDAPLWASNTEGNPGAVLRLQSDGALVIRSAEGHLLWSTGVTKTKPARGSFSKNLRFRQEPT